MKFDRFIYLQYQALYDLRQGCMFTCSPDFATAVMGKHDYFLRDEDVFDGGEKFGVLSKATIGKLINQRPDLILPNSLVTKVDKLIQQIYLETLKTNAPLGIEMNIKVHLNVHPYSKYLNAEQIDQIRSLLQSKLKDISVVVIDVDERRLTLKEVDDNYVAMVFYNYGVWAEHRQDEFRKRSRMTEVPIYVPRMFFGDKPKPEIMAQYEKEKADVFELWEKVSKRLINLNHVPTAFFCADLPLNKEDYTDLVIA